MVCIVMAYVVMAYIVMALAPLAYPAHMPACVHTRMLPCTSVAAGYPGNVELWGMWR